MHPLSKKFRVCSLNPIFFKYTINNVILVYSLANSSLIGGDIGRLKSTIITSFLLLMVHLSFSNICFCRSLAFLSLSTSLSLALRFCYFLQLYSSFQVLSLAFLQNSNLLLISLLTLLFSVFLSQLLCLLFLFLLFLLCFQC